MTLQPKIKLEGISQQDLQPIIISWLNHQPEQIERLAHSDKPEIKQFLSQQADAELAQARTDDLSHKARQCNKSTKNLIKTIVIFVGALTFSAAPQLLASGAARGPLAISAGILGGGAATFFVEELGVKGVTKKRRRHNSLSAQDSLENQHSAYPSQNQLVDFYFNAQKVRLLQVEGENLTTDFKADLAIAGLLSVVEGATAFVLILPAGLGMAFLAAGFPVALTWAAILFQSRHFDFAEYCADLIKKYEPFQPSPEVSEEEARQVQSLDYSFKYVAEGDKTGLLKNLDMARAYFDICYADKKLQQIAKHYIHELNELRLQLCEQLKHLEEQWVMPEIDIAGSAPTEEQNLDEKLKNQKAEWIAQKTCELEALYQEYAEMITFKYEQQFLVWQEEKARAQKMFTR
ncbi:MAG: hypothetical protein KME46_25650 [Brasilonema angustatum HA4187-MV1]|jgi:hypothetical protein|nr:hypothetical protein [Brasilonema angustatum HA4187-MV1]